MDATVYKDKNVIRALGQVVPVKLNTDKEGRKPGEKYKIEFLPTILALDPNGKVIAKGGPMDAAGMIKFINAAQAKLDKQLKVKKKS